MTAILSADGVSYRAQGRALVDAVSLDLMPGSLTVVTGPNGAGKSTLFRLLSGELTPTSGAVFCDGAPLRQLTPWQLAARRAVMTQAIQLSSPFTVLEVARLGVEGIGKGMSAQRRAEIVEQSLAAGDVLALAAHRYETLSGGEQRRVQFARALAQLEAGRTFSERQALLLDEPIANLDLRHQLTLLDAARAVAARGVAVLAILHDLNLAARYADTLAIMRGGRLVASGEPADVLSRDGLLSTVFEIDLAVTNLSPNGGALVVPSHWLEGSRHP